ncbi:MAG: nucleotidyltransferase domain-containing protein [Deltaproteobacteria bacterium]|nr:nucleotidyltransferase domain-containing protein [Deltaproteobacteria bacterium]
MERLPLQFTSEDQVRLRALGIDVLYLFGSHAEGVATASSDVDVGVVAADAKGLSQGTNALYLELYKLLSRYVPNSDRLDIVFLQRAPLELRFDVVKHGIPIFSSSDDARLQFEERTTIAYCDFRPLLRQFDRAILEKP